MEEVCEEVGVETARAWFMSFMERRGEVESSGLSRPMGLRADTRDRARDEPRRGEREKKDDGEKHERDREGRERHVCLPRDMYRPLHSPSPEFRR
jgi:hypothetical protein